MIAFTGVGVAARDALPGDMLWGVAQVLYTDHAQAVQAATSARENLRTAEDLLEQGDREAAEAALRSAKEQMDWFKRNVPNDPTALPPVLDVEWNGHSQTCPKKLPKAQALAMVAEMLEEMERYTGKRPIIYTDIMRDGVLEGLNFDSTLALANAVDVPVIASDGLASLADVEQLVQPGCARLAGAITGRALYDGRIDAAAALAMVRAARSERVAQA